MKRKLFTALLLVLVMAVSASAFGGREKWSFKPDNPVTSGVAVSGNRVFFGTETGKIYALDKNTGRLIWDYKVENTIYGVPSVVGDNVVFATGSGEIICLAMSDGSYKWSAGGIGGQNTQGKAVNDGLSDGTATGGGLVYVSKDDRKVHAFSAKDGRTAWTYMTGDQGVRAAPTYAEGFVFVGEYDGIFSILDAKSGKRVNGGGAGGAVNTPTVSGGNVYFSAWDGSVNAVQVKGVEPLWNVNAGDVVTTQPEVADGKVIVGTGRGSVVAFDAKNGGMLWKFETNSGSISAKPVLADGVVFVGGEAGPMIVLDARTGKQVGTIGGGNGIGGNPAYSEGVLYFSNGDFYAYE